MPFEFLVLARFGALGRYYDALKAGQPLAWACLFLIGAGLFVSMYLHMLKAKRIKTRSSTPGSPGTTARSAGPKCPVCHSPVEPQGSGRITCPACRAEFPWP